MRPYLLCRLIFFALAVMLLSACSDSAEQVADTTVTTVATTTTQSTTTTTEAPTTTVLEGSPVPLPNGDFETGDLTAWSTESWGEGKWLVYEDGSTPPDPSITDTAEPFDVPDPPQGEYAAVTDMNYSGVRFLYRDIEVTGSWTLHAIVFYENSAMEISDQPDLGSFDGDIWFSGSGINHQQFRVDVVDPQAPIQSLEADDVLAVVFQTQSGDPPSMEPTQVSIDLSPWEGQTIRLRAAQIDNQGPLRAGIDNVQLLAAD